MKKPIAWHKECLVNRRNYLQRLREFSARQLSEIQRAEDEILFYDFQITRAEAMGKDGFDQDKFGVKK